MAEIFENLAAVYDKLKYYGVRESAVRVLRRAHFETRSLLDMDEKLSARAACKVAAVAPSPLPALGNGSGPPLAPDARETIREAALTLAEPWRLRDANSIDWSLDENSGNRLPNKHFRHIGFRTTDDSGERMGDFMLPNELNKHGWVPLLTMAWRLSGDIVWLSALETLLQSWRSTFRVGWGVPYMTTLNVGQRLLNWSMAARLIDGTSKSEVRLRTFLAREGYREALFLETYNTSYYEQPNNYLFCESVAPLALFATFPDLPRADARRAYWREILADACEDQIDSDGFTLEGSLAYSRFIGEILCLAVAFGESSVSEPLKRLARALSTLTSVDGMLPSFGDISTERALDLGIWNDMRDSRTFLALASEVLGERLERGAGGTDIELYLATGIANRQSGRPRTVGDTVYRSGGYAVAERSWGQLVVDFADIGQRGRGGHGHCDVGSFCIDDDAGPLVVDPGTLFYTADRKTRNLYRSSKMHNLTRLDEGEMAVLSNDMFRVRMAPHVECRSAFDDGTLSLQILHEGFLIGGARVPVRRELEVSRDGVALSDSWEHNRPAVSAVHFAPGRKLRRFDKGFLIETPTGPAWRLVHDCVELDIEVADYLFSSRYAKGIPASKLMLRPREPVRRLSFRLYPDTGL